MKQIVKYSIFQKHALGMVTTDKVYRKYSTILPCAAAINLFPFIKRRRLIEKQRRLVGTYEWKF